MSRGCTHDDWVRMGSRRINPLRKKEYIPEYADIASRIVASGGRVQDLAYQLGVPAGTIREWKRAHPEFKRAVNKGKQQVKSVLIQRGIDAACGYRYTDIKVKGRGQIGKDGKLDLVPGQEVVVEKTIREVPPDSRLLMFLVSAIDHQLGNEDWVNIKHIDSHSEKAVTHKIDVSSVSRQIDRLSAGLKRLPKQESVPVIDAQFEPIGSDGREGLQETERADEAVGGDSEGDGGEP